MPKFAYFEGKFVPFTEAKVSIMTHAFNYGTGVFEGIRAYWNEQEAQLFVVRLRDHYRRLLQSTKVLRMQLGLDAEQMSELDHRTAAPRRVSRGCLHPAAGLQGQRGDRCAPAQSDATSSPSSATPFGKYIEQQEGAKVCFSSWRRNDDNAIPPRGKVTGAYVNSALIKSEAMLNGFDEAIVLNADGHMAEGSAENFFIVRGGKLITPPVTANILEGITRQAIMDLAKVELGWTQSSARLTARRSISRMRRSSAAPASK